MALAQLDGAPPLASFAGTAYSWKRTLVGSRPVIRTGYGDLVVRPVPAPTGGGGSTAVGRSVGLQWAVRALVARSNDVRWGVLGRAGTKDLDLRWAVRSLVHGDSDARWAVRALASDDVDLKWGIDLVLEPVGADLGLQWGVRALAGADNDLRWAARATTGRALDARWSVRQGVGRLLTLDWAVQALVGASGDLRWAARAPVSRDLDARWAVRGLTADDLELLWAFTGFGDPDIELALARAVWVLEEAKPVLRLGRTSTAWHVDTTPRAWR